MHKTVVGAIAGAAAFAIAGVAVAGGFQFKTTLTSSEEGPPPGVVLVRTTAEAKVNIKLDSANRTATYNLRVTEPITDVLQAHLHKGPPGEIGPVAVFLYPPAPPASLIPGITEGSLARGEFGPSNLCYAPTAPYCVNGVGQWDAFVSDLEAGNIYANVHTVVNPAGEIRGQVHRNSDHD